MSRYFSSKQRKMLRLLAGNQCSECGQKLLNSFHADHRIPFSKGGKTNLNNGQALCANCNLKKGVTTC